MAHRNECCQVIGAVSLGLHDVPDLCVDLRDEILKSVNDPVCHVLHVSPLLGVVDSPVIIRAVDGTPCCIEGWVCGLYSIV